jgi:hypothetical protein
VGDYTTKTESFLKKTKDMPLQEFAKYIIKESGEVHSELPLALQYISSISENENVVRDLVVAFKQQNRINQLVEALFEYPEAYAALGNLLGDGQKGLSRCNSLVRAMNEIVGPPLGMGDMEDEDEPETRRIGNDEMGDEEDPDMDDDDMDDEEDPDDEDLDDMDDDDMEDDDEDMDDDELGDEEDLDGLGGEEDMGATKIDIGKLLARKDLMRSRGRLGMENLIQAIKKQNG